MAANIPSIAIAPANTLPDSSQSDADPYELGKRMADRLRSTDDVDDINRDLVADLSTLTTPVDRLNYLSYFSTNFTAPGKVKLAPRDTVEVLHGISAVIDAHTPHITPRGEEFHMGSDVYNASSPLFEASLQRERELIAAGCLDRATSQQIADIHSVFARKGRTSYLLHDMKRDRGRVDPAVLILLATTTVARYAALDMQERADGIRMFMRSLTEYVGVEDPGEEAAVRTLEELISEFPLFGNMIISYEVGFRSMFRGLYLFSPHLYKFSAGHLSAQGHPELAEKHSNRAQRDQGIADHLGLKRP